ncbi:hypothetical protein D0Y65_050574 [Glycine soja]|uniref:AAA ATPase AAA+ lid domain-containing protein n=1 Tax=Glycine soja TaxID=3848 RepID=A0A445FCN4_GLYSO|nr:hypothetical protein D0Y65_050574 [Glycine soja]
MPPKLAVVIADDDLPSSLGQLAASLCDSNFALTSSGKPLSSVANHSSTVASKVKKAFGLESPGLASRKRPESASSQGKPKLPLIVGKLMRNQMKVSEAMDSHVRRVLLRISAGQFTEEEIPLVPSKGIMVGPPYVENMEKILRTLLAKEKVDNELEFKELATMTEGYTGSDLKNLCTIAAYRPVRELIQQERLKSLVSGNCIIYFEFNWYDLKNSALIFVRYLS